MKKHLMEQGSPEWFQKKKGTISGTYLKAIMGTPRARQEAIYELIAENLIVGVEGDMEYENPMARGTRLEPDARKIFEFETDLVVEQIGYGEHDEESKIGYSPDGIIAGTDDTEDIEIKCPEGKNFVKVWLTNEVPDEYYWQVVQAFVVNPKLKKRYFVTYHPNIPVHPLHIIEVYREDLLEDISKAFESEKAVLKEVENALSKLITL